MLPSQGYRRAAIPLPIFVGRTRDRGDPLGTLGYYLALPFMHVLARLPWPVLYRFSDLCCLLLYRVAGYRVQVVRTNIRNSFPEKGEGERRRIEREFYRWFCDLWLETTKTLVITPQELEQRVVVEEPVALRECFANGRSVILVMGHWGNWELGGARFSLLGLHRLMVIYHPLSNPHFEKLVTRMRTRWGTGLYAMNDTLRSMLRDRGQVTATAFIADQSPRPESATWVRFLNQDTPVFNGTEKIARKLGYPVFYVGISREKRGYYRMRIEELVPDPAKTAPGEITVRHTARLEQDIRRQPAFWLWTHRRWKHRRPGGDHVGHPVS